MKLNGYSLLLLACVCGGVSADVLFEENFNDPALKGWRTQGGGSFGPLPGDFDFGYTEKDSWHPGSIPGSQAALYIDSAPTRFGGSGNALISTFESTGSGYVSDGFLWKDITPSNEVYVSFRVKLEPDFGRFNSSDVSGSIKLFRVLSWDGVNPRASFFAGGNSAPIYLFNWQQSSFGVRHKHAFRCDPQNIDDNYFCRNGAIGNPPQSVNNGDMSANFTTHVASLMPEIPDLVNGGLIPYTSTPNVWHAQVYGDIWHHMEFYLKLNNSPGVKNGELRVWLDGEPIIDMRQIAWIKTGGSVGSQWNAVAFGGNGDYHWDDSSTFAPHRERWIAIDEILVLDALPLMSNPPTDIRVE